MGRTPDSATSRASSKLAPAVTHFPLLLFLEVLMSMRNSAERLSEKKEEGEEKREGERDREVKGWEKAGSVRSRQWWQGPCNYTNCVSLTGPTGPTQYSWDPVWVLWLQAK